jgi:hypothetical protein
MFMLSRLIALLAPVDNIADSRVPTTILVVAGVDSLVDIDEALFTLDALHVCLPDQFISLLRWSLPLRHFGFRELVGVRCIASVTLLAK